MFFFVPGRLFTLKWLAEILNTPHIAPSPPYTRLSLHLPPSPSVSLPALYPPLFRSPFSPSLPVSPWPHSLSLSLHRHSQGQIIIIYFSEIMEIDHCKSAECVKNFCRRMMEWAGRGWPCGGERHCCTNCSPVCVCVFCLFCLINNLM